MTATYSGNLVGLEDTPPLPIPHMKTGVRRKYEEAERLARQAQWLIQSAVDDEYEGRGGLKRGNMHLEMLYAADTMCSMAYHMAKGAIVSRRYEGNNEIETYAGGPTTTTCWGSEEDAKKGAGWRRDQDRNNKKMLRDWRKKRAEAGRW